MGNKTCRPYQPTLPCPNCSNVGMYQDYDWLSGKTYYGYCDICTKGKELQRQFDKENIKLSILSNV